MLQEFERSGPVMHLLLRYTQSLITQMAQTAACNRHHSLDQQLCRWLLLSLDRLASNELVMTQELIANMLVCGVRASRRRPAGCTKPDYRLLPWRIIVLDRDRLEKAPVNATPWLGRNARGCYRQRSRPNRRVIRPELGIRRYYHLPGANPDHTVSLKWGQCKESVTRTFA